MKATTNSILTAPNRLGNRRRASDASRARRGSACLACGRHTTESQGVRANQRRLVIRPSRGGSMRAGYDWFGYRHCRINSYSRVISGIVGRTYHTWTNQPQKHSSIVRIFRHGRLDDPRRTDSGICRQSNDARTKIKHDDRRFGNLPCARPVCRAGCARTIRSLPCQHRQSE